MSKLSLNDVKKILLICVSVDLSYFELVCTDFVMDVFFLKKILYALFHFVCLHFCYCWLKVCSMYELLLLWMC